MTVEDRLKEIGEAISRGAKPESFQAEIDKLLGTEMEDRDEIAEATWENNYRGGSND